MALLPCRECGKEISAEADRCPHCGANLPTDAARVRARHRAERKADRLRVVIGAAILVVAFGAIGGWYLTARGPRPSPKSAWKACADRVTGQLTSPSTASFQPFDENRIVQLGGGLYHVRAWVDAQNAFGGTIRSQYVCEIRWRQGGGWDVESLRFEAS